MTLKLTTFSDFFKRNLFSSIIIGIFIIFLCAITVFPLLSEKKENSFENNTQQNFNIYADKLLTDQLSSDTLSLHFYLSDTSKYGLDNITPTLGNYTYESMTSSQNHFINEINLLKNFNYKDLSTEQQITYDVLMEYFKDQLDFSDLCLCSQVLSPTTGLQAQLPVLLCEYTFSSQKDIENYLSILSLIKNYYGQICEFQKLKAENNSFISKFACDKIIAQCKEFIGDKNACENLLHTSFLNRLSGVTFLTDQEKNNYITRDINVIEESIYPAYENIANTLWSLQKKGACKNKNGLFYLKNGRDYYEYLVKNYTGSSKSVSDLKAEIQLNLTGYVQAIYSILTKNPELEKKFYGKTESDLKPNDIISSLSKKISNNFPTTVGDNRLSEILYTLKYVDKSLEDFLSPAFYLTPPIDNPQHNIIYINGSESMKNQDFYATIAHEGIPGHMYQSWFFSSTNPHPVRHIINYGGYTEGWATYVEFMSYQYRYKDQNLAKAFACSSAYSLALYSICDIGINYDGWTFKDTTKYLADYNITDKKVCESIFQSVIEEPANYLQYYVGFMEITRLKDSLKKKLGDSFNLKDFHKAFLAVGPAPFDVVNKWIMYEYAK